MKSLPPICLHLKKETNQFIYESIVLERTISNLVYASQ